MGAHSAVWQGRCLTYDRIRPHSPSLTSFLMFRLRRLEVRLASLIFSLQHTLSYLDHTRRYFQLRVFIPDSNMWRHLTPESMLTILQQPDGLRSIRQGRYSCRGLLRPWGPVPYLHGMIYNSPLSIREPVPNTNWECGVNVSHEDHETDWFLSAYSSPRMTLTPWLLRSQTPTMPSPRASPSVVRSSSLSRPMLAPYTARRYVSSPSAIRRRAIAHRWHDWLGSGNRVRRALLLSVPPLVLWSPTTARTFRLPTLLPLSRTLLTTLTRPKCVLVLKLLQSSDRMIWEYEMLRIANKGASNFLVVSLLYFGFMHLFWLYRTWVCIGV